MPASPRILVVGTRNAKKCREMCELLAGLPLDVRPLADFPFDGSVEETGDTFEANAAAKALGYARATGHWCVADDSGLEVDSLGGRPGVFSSRWAGTEGDDLANNRKLLEELRAVPPARRQARYVCVVVLASPQGPLLSARGSCEGLIIDHPAGRGGFGYDPYFFLPDRGCTMAQLLPEAKHAISHRGHALRELRRKLSELLQL
jgi:XTP/dITP diphosphohydrolase